MYLRVSLTDRCNLRCTYCLPELARFKRGGAARDELHVLVDEIIQAAGVRKIRLTGGEPTLDPELVEHVRFAASRVPCVGLTSNGVRLAPLLPALRAAGLTRLNISLDAADPDGFRRMARRDGYGEVLSAIRAARELGFAPLKVNCVTTRQTDATAMVRLALKERFHVRFIELMAIGEARATWETDYISAAELRDRLASAGLVLEERAELDEPTSRVWLVPGEDPAEISVGFITTVSAPFCGSCDRLRLTRSGRLHYCLFDASGTDLLEPLRQRGTAAVRDLVRHVVRRKHPPPQFVRLERMAAIGG